MKVNRVALEWWTGRSEFMRIYKKILTDGNLTNEQHKKTREEVQRVENCMGFPLVEVNRWAKSAGLYDI